MASSASTAAGRRRAASSRGASSSRARKPASRRPAKAPSRRAPTRKPRAAQARGKAAAKARPKRLSWAWRAALVLVALAVVAAGYLWWLRDSSLVAVTKVQVTGVTSDDRKQIVASLTRAGEEMTTLHLQPDRLDAVAAQFPTVAGVRAEADFPHGLTIAVDERPPALLASDGNHQLAVAADGTVLPGIDASNEKLPQVSVSTLPQAGELDGDALQEALILGATPVPLRPLIERTSYRADDGVTVTMQGDIELRFGDGSGAAHKWAAAAAVLADPDLTALTYIDVRVPKRPAVGGTGQGATTTTVDPAPTTIP
jgi:cell division protein FtsQ